MDGSFEGRTDLDTTLMYREQGWPNGMASLRIRRVRQTNLRKTTLEQDALVLEQHMRRFRRVEASLTFDTTRK
jgi:hypothetical protein